MATTMKFTSAPLTRIDQSRRDLGRGGSMQDKITVHFGNAESTCGLRGCFVAGGAITSLYTNAPINDFDIYPKSHEARNDAIRWMFESGYWCAHASSRALTFVQDDMQVQIMMFDEFKTADVIFDFFDFTACMGAYDLDTHKFVLHDKFLIHCSQRFLSFNPKTKFPYASAWRVRKYEDKGFTIGKMEYFKILLACAEKPVKSWDDLREQIGGVYGESMDIPDGEEYTLDRAFEVISNMKPCGPQGGYANVEEALACTSDIEIPYFVVAESKSQYGATTPQQIFAMMPGDDDWSKIGAIPKKGKLVGLKEVYPDLTFYKKVYVDGDKYRSLYKPEFTYALGEEVSSGSPYIYAYDSIAKARKHTYYNAKAKQCVVLQMTANEEDVVFDPSQPRLKKVRVVAVLPVEEIESDNN